MSDKKEPRRIGTYPDGAPIIEGSPGVIVGTCPKCGSAVIWSGDGKWKFCIRSGSAGCTYMEAATKNDQRLGITDNRGIP